MCLIVRTEPSYFSIWLVEKHNLNRLAQTHPVIGCSIDPPPDRIEVQLLVLLCSSSTPSCKNPYNSQDRTSHIEIKFITPSASTPPNISILPITARMNRASKQPSYGSLPGNDDETDRGQLHRCLQSWSIELYIAY
jgi:hypothetical protein